MKILLFFTFYLISGPVSCFDVIGYSGGDVIIYCTKPENKGYNMYFCKNSANTCVYTKSDSSLNTWDHKGRVTVEEITGFLTVLYRDLTLDDTGVYHCGGTGEWSNTVNLNVKTDKCCSGPKTKTRCPGETITIKCSYPEEFSEKAKFFSTLKGLVFTEMAHTSHPLRGRFSLSEDRMSNTISVRISDVRKHDEGVYYCGAPGDKGAVSYETFFTKIHLQVTESKRTQAPPAPIIPTTTAASTPETLTAITTSAPGSNVTLSIVLALLLIGGVLVFFIVILKKRQGSPLSTRTNCRDHKEVPAVVNNDEETGTTTQTPPKDQELTYSTLTPPKDQELTYSTVSFLKNPSSSTDASVRVNKEEPEIEYATVKHTKRLK